jgi:L-ascorbate metabolism protein UlaG (beta-lactamase superfamily)
MNIKFINHSSILLDSGNHKILCDPWYKGSIFNDGWKLIHESNQSINDFDLDFIWYSHEHPDHFSVLDINKINEDKKKKSKYCFKKL